jgi:hypothetical protein
VSAQGHLHSIQPKQPEVISIVNGAENPASVPDSVAFKHFFTLLSRKPSTDQADERRRRSYLTHYFRPGFGAAKDEDRTLTAAQTDKLLHLVDDLSPKLRALGDRMVAAYRNGGSQAEILSLREAADSEVMTAANALHTRIDADAASKIWRHVLEHVKRGVTIRTVRVYTAAQ